MSNETRWTPGPWGLMDQHAHLNFIEIPVESPSRMAIVCKCVGTTNPMLDFYAGASEVKANAHLIAAAPELYAELSMAFHQAERVIAGKDTDDDFEAWVERTRAALAKARGEAT